MAFCPNCGSPVEGKFCGKCGSAVGEGAATPSAAPPSPPPAPGTAPSSGLSENVAAALCYVLGLVTGIIFLVLAPYNQNKTIRFHAFQSIFLHVAVLVIFWGILPVLGMVTSGLGWFLSPLVGLASLLLWLFMIWKAYQGERIVLPVIGDLAAKQA